MSRQSLIGQPKAISYVTRAPSFLFFFFFFYLSSWCGVSLIQWKHESVETNDQWFSLTDQLNMGVRLLELDVHWVKVKK